MSGTLKSIVVLVPGNIHPITLAKLGERFALLHQVDFSGLLKASGMRETVRGIASIVPTGRDMIDAFPNLEIIAHFGVGYDSVDVGHAAAKGIVVTNTPDVLNEDVADIAVALLLNTVRDLPRAESWLRAGHWASQGPYPLTALTLRNRTVGIFGLGRVGQAVARRLAAFGLPIAYHNRHPIPGLSYIYHASLLNLAEAVDTLISVVPSSAATAKIIDASVFRALGPNGVFINIGRGATVDQDALIDALSRRVIAAAGLDVFAQEPQVPPALLDLPNASLLPHVGSATDHTRAAMANLCADNLISWFSAGRPLTPVPETTHLSIADIRPRLPR
jgi:lactate dehydrogenase-like 2-hydroxyacid dehydrogenase